MNRKWRQLSVWLLFSLSVWCGVTAIWMLNLSVHEEKPWLSVLQLFAFLLNTYSSYTAFRSFWYWKRLCMVIDDTQRRL